MDVEVVLVNEQDEQVGVMEKMAAHQQALLHRAFSVFLFNSKGEMLLQQRALTKYHSPGLWTNACCSHPYPEEAVQDAANRRLMEELGFTTRITKAFSFVYKATFDNGLTEHEFDHVFVGTYEGGIHPNVDEVVATSYVSMEALTNDLEQNPQNYTAWFKIAFPQLQTWLQENNY